MEFAFLCWLARALRKKCPNNGVFSGPYFPVFVLNEEIYSGSLHIQFECRKIRTRKNSVTLFTLWRQNVFQNYFQFWTSIIKNHLWLKILSFSDRKSFLIFNPLSANSRKWSNALKQFISKLSTSCLCLFDYFVGWALKGLREGSLMHKVLIYRQICKTYIKSKYLHT